MSENPTNSMVAFRRKVEIAARTARSQSEHKLFFGVKDPMMERSLTLEEVLRWLDAAERGILKED